MMNRYGRCNHFLANPTCRTLTTCTVNSLLKQRNLNENRKDHGSLYVFFLHLFGSSKSLLWLVSCFQGCVTCARFRLVTVQHDKRWLRPPLLLFLFRPPGCPFLRPTNPSDPARKPAMPPSGGSLTRPRVWRRRRPTKPLNMPFVPCKQFGGSRPAGLDASEGS